MPAPEWENLDDFLALDEFAVTARITLPDSSTRSAVGIFDDPYLNAQAGEYEVDTSEPRFTCKEADLAGVARKCVVIIGARTFYAMGEPQPDGTGMAVLRMTPQA